MLRLIDDLNYLFRVDFDPRNRLMDHLVFLVKLTQATLLCSRDEETLRLDRRKHVPTEVAWYAHFELPHGQLGLTLVGSDLEGAIDKAIDRWYHLFRDAQFVFVNWLHWRRKALATNAT